MLRIDETFRDEVKAARNWRDKHLMHWKAMKERFTGPAYRHENYIEGADIENIVGRTALLEAVGAYATSYAGSIVPSLLLAALKGPVRDVLERDGLVGASGESVDRAFVTLHEAVKHAARLHCVRCGVARVPGANRV